MPDGEAREANHRIANDLTLIAALMRIQASKLPQHRHLPAQEVRALLHETSARIDAVGRLHRLLTADRGYQAVDLLTYLREIAAAAVTSLSSKEQTQILIDLEPGCAIPARQATALGLVLGEAITNALKYSHPTGVPGKIGITSRRSESNGLIVEVIDDGVGFAEDFDPHTSQSTGILLMRKLAGQLGARLEFETSAVGLSVRLELPSPERFASEEKFLVADPCEPAA